MEWQTECMYLIVMRDCSVLDCSTCSTATRLDVRSLWLTWLAEMAVACRSSRSWRASVQH